MTNQARALTTEDLEQVAGGFKEEEHGQMTVLQMQSQQMSYMMSAIDTVIKSIGEGLR